ncbi:hypothetical protein NDU88_001888 [Pleurodeles waltl]|uniref:Uncharacterized protein n=1 Tax=Pleurodeles waltl TaxID=8319 RepID=A0AAV7LZV8_PLEWA|nr:hypothetical protein NDU88_001888 [Pleurodeles waltl]
MPNNVTHYKSKSFLKKASPRGWGTWRPVRELVRELSVGREVSRCDAVEPASELEPGNGGNGACEPQGAHKPHLFVGPGRVIKKRKTSGKKDAPGETRTPAKGDEERCWKSDSSIWAEAARGVRRGRRYTSRCSLRGALPETPGLSLRKNLGGSWRRGVGDCTRASQCMSPVKRRPRGARAEVGELESVKKADAELQHPIPGTFCVTCGNLSITGMTSTTDRPLLDTWEGNPLDMYKRWKTYTTAVYFDDLVLVLAKYAMTTRWNKNATRVTGPGGQQLQ